MNKNLIKGLVLAFIVATTTAALINKKRNGSLDKLKIIENDIFKKIRTLKKRGIFIAENDWQILDMSEYKIQGTSLKRIEVFIETSSGLYLEYYAHFNFDTYKKRVEKKEISIKNPISKSYVKISEYSGLNEWENHKQIGV